MNTFFRGIAKHNHGLYVSAKESEIRFLCGYAERFEAPTLTDAWDRAMRGHGLDRDLTLPTLAQRREEDAAMHKAFRRMLRKPD